MVICFLLVRMQHMMWLNVHIDKKEDRTEEAYRNTNQGKPTNMKFM